MVEDSRVQPVLCRGDRVEAESRWNAATLCGKVQEATWGEVEMMTSGKVIRGVEVPMCSVIPIVCSVPLPKSKSSNFPRSRSNMQ